MQLGGGCASGTLYAVGGGRSVAFVTLLFFIIGSTIGAAHLSFWTEDLPSFAPISLATSTGLGYGGAWIVSIILFGVIAWITLVVERKEKRQKWLLFQQQLAGNVFSAVHGHYSQQRSC